MQLHEPMDRVEVRDLPDRSGPTAAMWSVLGGVRGVPQLHPIVQHRKQLLEPRQQREREHPDGMHVQLHGIVVRE